MNGMHEGSGNQPAALRGARWRRAVVASSVVVALAGAILACAPTVVCHTTLGQQVVSSSLARCGIAVVMAEATGGWVKPLAFSGVEFRDPQGKWSCRIREIRTTKGLFGLFSGDPDLGMVTLVEPEIECQIDETGRLPVAAAFLPSQATCEFLIEQGKFRLRIRGRELPLVDLSGLNLSGRVSETQPGQRLLIVDAFQVLNREPLSELHAAQNLALIAPVLSQSTRLTGSASVWCDEIRVPLDAPPEGSPKDVAQLPIHGRAEFHALDAHLKPEWAGQIARLAGQLTQTSLPDRITVARDSVVTFAAESDGISHQGMAFLLPDIGSGIRIESAGTVGLNEDLDLTLSVRLPSSSAPANAAAAMLNQLLSEPVRLKVVGTVSQPRIELPPGSAVLGELSARIAPEQHSEEVPPISQAVFELIQDAGQTDKARARRELPGGILQLIRSLQAEKERKAGRRKE